VKKDAAGLNPGSAAPVFHPGLEYAGASAGKALWDRAISAAFGPWRTPKNPSSTFIGAPAFLFAIHEEICYFI
jgi:hypothetical protein